MLNVALIGAGNWGKRYLNTLVGMEGIQVRWLYNRRTEFPDSAIPRGARFTRDLVQVLNDTETTAVIISTPPRTHYPIARDALEAGKDVLLEKPMTETSRDALKLTRLAEREQRILMVGHIFLYNPAVDELRRMVEEHEFGRLFYIFSRRTSMGPRTDVSCMWDLAPHDLSIMNHLNGGIPKAVSARGVSYLKPGIEDVADLVVEYNNEVTGFIHLSWLEPKKIRETTVVGENRVAVLDDTTEEKLQVYELSDMENAVTPELDPLTPLEKQCLHFRDCVATRKRPLTDGYQGYVNVRILECAQQALDTRRRIPVEVEGRGTL